MSNQENPAITRFRDYLRVNTMQPNPDYQKCMDFLSQQATDLGTEVSEQVKPQSSFAREKYINK